MHVPNHTKASVTSNLCAVATGSFNRPQADSEWQDVTQSNLSTLRQIGDVRVSGGGKGEGGKGKKSILEFQ